MYLINISQANLPSIHTIGSPISFIFILMLFLITMGCNSSQDTIPGWTLKEESIQFEEDLFLSGTEEYYFGRITALDVDSKGRIFIADGSEQEIKILSADGKLIRTVGQRGKGPGEFNALSDMMIARGDSIYIIDSKLQRLSVYSPDGEFVYDHSIASDAGMAGQLLVAENETGFAIRYTPSFCHREDEENTVLRISAEGEVSDTLFNAPCRESLVSKSNGAIQVLAKPYGRRPIFAMKPGADIYYGWSDSLAAMQYDLKGAIISQLSLPHDPTPVTKESLTELISHRPETIRDKLREGSPETKPAFETMLIDQENRVWFKRPTTNSEESVWWVVDRDERVIYTANLSAEINLLQIKDGYAYAHTKSKTGEPSVVRYNISFED